MRDNIIIILDTVPWSFLRFRTYHGTRPSSVKISRGRGRLLARRYHQPWSRVDHKRCNTEIRSKEHKKKKQLETSNKKLHLVNDFCFGERILMMDMPLFINMSGKWKEVLIKFEPGTFNCARTQTVKDE